MLVLHPMPLPSLISGNRTEPRSLGQQSTKELVSGVQRLLNVLWSVT
jgi:hypothetical protein